MSWTSLITFDVPTLTLSSIIGAGFSGVVWLLKTHSEKKITAKIEHEFNQKLEDHKAELQKEAARYEGDIQTRFEVFKLTTSQAQDRRMRSNEKEYNACIECWHSLHKAFSSLKLILNIKEFEIDRRFLDLDKEINKSQMEIYQAEIILSKNSIFFNKDLYKKCTDFISVLSAANEEKRNVRLRRHSILEPTQQIDKVKSDGDEILNEIREAFRSNLYIRAIDFTD